MKGMWVTPITPKLLRKKDCRGDPPRPERIHCDTPFRSIMIWKGVRSYPAASNNKETGSGSVFLLTLHQQT